MIQLQDAYAFAVFTLLCKGLVLTTLCGLAITLHRRSSAAWRHGVWTLCMVAGQSEAWHASTRADVLVG